MKNFFNWLFDYRNPPIFLALFILGCAFLVVALIMALFVLYPLLGIAAIFGLLFGVPVVAYLMGRKTDD